MEKHSGKHFSDKQIHCVPNYRALIRRRKIAGFSKSSKIVLSAYGKDSNILQLEKMKEIHSIELRTGMKKSLKMIEGEKNKVTRLNLNLLVLIVIANHIQYPTTG